MKNKFHKFLFLGFICLIGCQSYTNYTTYFNTFYNAERLMKESEEEFEYQDDKLRVFPRVFVPEDRILFQNLLSSGIPPFPKGKSEYIEKTLFLMAKSYYYREEWRPSAIKCSELIDRYPEGDLAPDAALLFAKNLLIERNFYSGKVLLSRTVDLAWLKQRYDILSEAFRIQAELSLYENDLEGALRPYKQAIVQTDDQAQKAKWQLDMAALLYRISKFELSAKAFAEVNKFKPDYLGKFESKLYQAASLSRLNKFKEAEEIIIDIENDGKFKEWKGFAFAERLNMMRLKLKDTVGKSKDFLDTKEKELVVAEKFADTTFINNILITCYQFERGMDFYQKNEYLKSLQYFVKSKSAKTPVFQTSYDMFKLLSDWDSKKSSCAPLLDKIQKGEKVSDTMRVYTSAYLYEIGRIHEKLNHQDSVLYYYKMASTVAPSKNEYTAKYMYAYMRKLQAVDPQTSDSLKEVIATNYSKTEYGKAMMKELGMTESFVIDTAADLFTSASDLRKTGEYAFANSQYLKIYNEYPKIELAPKSLYTIGWTFENKQHDIDSAIFYYKLVIEKYPKSKYANDLRTSLDYFAVLKSGTAIPDSLKMKDTSAIVAPIDSTQIRKADEPFMDVEKMKATLDGNTPFNIKMNPMDLIDKAKNFISNPTETFKSIEMPKLEELPGKAKEYFLGPKDKSKEEPKDSTNVNKPKK
ncbi:MAG: tetratricopeptide repeat protein [Candidatus Kapabacteria bacterium]|nr:tetratricopeptide repeat protein [Candidatus Kapabacteria bacterium]